MSWGLCHHGAVLDAGRRPDAVALPSFGPRMVSGCCGVVGAYVRPNWTERAQRESPTGEPWRQVFPPPRAHAAMPAIEGRPVNMRSARGLPVLTLSGPRGSPPVAKFLSYPLTSLCQSGMLGIA